MSERHFARTRTGAAADERGYARRMMGAAERPHPADAPAGEVPGEASNHADLEHLGGLERRQQRRQALGQHRLAGAGRSDHQQVVAARRGDFEGALGRLLTLDVLEVGHRLVAGVRRRLRPPQGLQTFEVVDELKKVRRRQDRHLGRGPSGLGAGSLGAGEPLAEGVRPDRRRERASDRRDRPVERQLAQHAIALDRLMGHGADGGHQPERDGKVAMAPFLGEVSGGEIDGDALRRQREADGVQRAAHPLAALGHGLVGEADDGEGG
jgi:hypothetical protein